MMNDRLRRAAIALLSGFLFVASGPTLVVRADPSNDSLGEVAIVEVIAQPAKRGSFARLSLRFDSSGTSSTRVVRVETAQGELGEFWFHGGRTHADNSPAGPGAAPGPLLAPTSPTLPLAPHEEVRLDTHHLHLMLGPLKRDLREGDLIEVTFFFEGGWSTTIPVHVHERAQTTGKRPSG